MMIIEQIRNLIDNTSMKLESGKKNRNGSAHGVVSLEKNCDMAFQKKNAQQKVVSAHHSNLIRLLIKEL